jgi:tRNA/tmRNA/rRNA uracil-C5-methylase (TrmA/RlmC/RlmD family)
MNPGLEPGQRLELDITTVAFGGDGVARHENFVIFVPFVVAGERVEAQIIEVKKRYATADLIRVLRPSPHRVEPRCRYYAHCAGCQYQHIEYGHQLEMKQAQIRDVFERIGKIKNPPVAPVVASPRPYHYRNKLVVHGPGRPGFWTTRGRSIVNIEQCPIARDEINVRLAEIAGQQLRHVHVTLRANAAGQTWSFVEPPADQLITETVLGRELSVPLASFFQVNREVIELALQHTRAILAASGCRVLVDAYCGIGLFALLLADLVEHVYGIEADAAAIAAANANVETWGLKNCDFYAGQTERLLLYTLRQCPLDQTCLILDPPRSGCGRPVLKTLREQRPRKLLYVSCAPPRLARDVKELTEHGYRLDRVTPFDMFPQTQHCEAVAELTRLD